MRAHLVFFLAIGCAPGLAHGDPCTEIEPQLRDLSQQLAHGEIARVEKALSPLEAVHPDCAGLVLIRARLQAAKGDAAAADTFLLYNALQPTDAGGYAYFSRLLLEQGEYQRAEMACGLARNADPNNPTAMAVQAEILDMKGHTQDAIKLMQEAIRLDPEDAETRFQLGSIHDRAKHPKEAVQLFSDAVGINPSDARAWDYLALNLEPLGEIDRAQQAYEKGLAADLPGPHFDSFLPYNYGRFLMKRNSLTASKQQLDRAVELTPEVRAPWYERARLNLRLKHYAQARTDGEKAISLDDPQGIIADLQIYALMEQIYEALGEGELAVKYAELSRSTPAPVQSEIDRTH